MTAVGSTRGRPQNNGQNELPIGYWPGIRQASTPLTFGLPVCPHVDLTALDAWLAETFAPDLAGERPPPESTIPDPTTLALGWRVLELAAYLQREAKLPVFEAGRIMRLDSNPTKPGIRIVRTVVPRLDFMPDHLTSLALRAALATVVRAANEGPQPIAREDLYQTLDRNVIKPISAAANFGVSTQPILAGAFQKNIPFRHLGAGIHQLGWGARGRILRRSALDGDSAIGAAIAGNKHHTAQYLSGAGVPVPIHVLVASESEAEHAAAQLGWPVVIKPADRARSEGVTIGIDNKQKLLAAYRHAAHLSKRILVEREVRGTCYRLMIANGEFLYAVRRRPRSVSGDGIHTVAELVDKASSGALKLPPWRRNKAIEIDSATCEALARQGKEPQSIPGSGERVELRPIESTEWGGDVEDATEEVHPENIRIAVESARLLGLLNAGVDIITDDVTRPWHENGAIINEINFAPHFGGTTTAKAKMPIFLQTFITGDGRIPVEAFVGGDAAFDAARHRQSELAAAGTRAFVTSHLETFDDQGHPIQLRSGSLLERTLALLMRREIAVLLLVIQTDEPLRTGLAVDRIEKIHRCGGFGSGDRRPKSADAVLEGRLLAFLKNYQGKSGRIGTGT